MHRCSNPLCVGEISLTSSYIRVDGRLFCGTACANSWVIANTALQGAEREPWQCHASIADSGKR